MSWEKVKLEDLCQSISDGDHQPPPKTEKGIPFVTISNITNTNKFDFSNTMFVPQEYYDKLDDKKKAHTGDILYSVVGSYGKPVFIDEEQKFVFQRHIAILRPNREKLKPLFLYYTMLSRDFFMQADSIAIGAAQKTVSLTSLRNMTIKIPTSDIQNKIINILSPYDKLIKNNQKQIKLLEESAQRLYKEWFVDLRFPGYKDIDIVDGVPEGWTKGVLSDIAKFKRGKTITKAQTINGNVPVVAGGLEPAYYHNTANTVSPVITVSGSGANAGFARLYNTDVFASDCSYVDNDTTAYIYFTYCFLKDNTSSLLSFQKGAAQPHVYAKDINAMKLIVPGNEHLIEYNNLAATYFKKIATMQKQIKQLTQARDRLLPKLMSGEIEV